MTRLQSEYGEFISQPSEGDQSKMLLITNTIPGGDTTKLTPIATIFDCNEPSTAHLKNESEELLF